MTLGKFLEALGSWIGTGSVFCHSFSFSNNVTCEIIDFCNHMWLHWLLNIMFCSSFCVLLSFQKIFNQIFRLFLFNYNANTVRRKCEYGVLFITNATEILKSQALLVFTQRNNNKKDSDEFWLWKSNLAVFDTSPLHQFLKFDNFLWIPINISWVVEFQRWWVLKSKIFG